MKYFKEIRKVPMWKLSQCAEQHYAHIDEKTEANRHMEDFKHVQWKKWTIISTSSKSNQQFFF